VSAMTSHLPSSTPKRRKCPHGLWPRTCDLCQRLAALRSEPLKRLNPLCPRGHDCSDLPLGQSCRECLQITNRRQIEKQKATYRSAYGTLGNHAALSEDSETVDIVRHAESNEHIPHDLSQMFAAIAEAYECRAVAIRELGYGYYGGPRMDFIRPDLPHDPDDYYYQNALPVPDFARSGAERDLELWKAMGNREYNRRYRYIDGVRYSHDLALPIDDERPHLSLGGR
jgi:hypothetical protein